MRTVVPLLIFFMIPQLTVAKHNVTVYYEAIGDGYALYADNFEHCDISVELTVNLRNLKFKTEKEELYFLRPRTTGQLLAEFVTLKKGKASGLSFKYFLNLGLSGQVVHESGYAYRLPFEEGHRYRVSQGYSDTGSHAGRPAIDFSMPIRTTVVAAREGTVVSTVDSNTKHCPVEACEKFNNYILIYHPDGTFGSYLHLAHNGIMVRPGDKVFPGQVIGKSGNTGWSKGPHLHFAVYEPGLRTKKYIRTKFIVDTEHSPIFLEKDNWYGR